ncbi:nuclear factor 7, brain-like isoform X1 [Chiloscyllium plagiosum]|uniref:nuclear factor 7, brain-like isoform X1 n=1 Tax=Chiloscyllium plagiosum TaxID=36176 RepID=UPI001CB8146E|nr:nuclear factor 7, brain-like isoform X1 [Chiloscyllium plagiosum]
MASADGLEKVRSQVTCPCCGGFYRDPVMLRCGHNLCRGCLKARCPQCGETLPGGGAEPRANRLLCSLAESIRELSASRDSSGSGASGRCSKHDEPTSMFCREDHRAICVICSTSRDHRDHTFLRLEDASAICQEELKALKGSLESKLEEYSKSQREDTADQVKLKKQISGLREDIQAEFTKLHGFLIDEERRFMMKLKEKEKLIVQLEDNMKRNSEESGAIRKFITDIQEVLQLQEEELIKTAKHIIDRTDDNFKKPTRFSVDLNLAELIGPVQYITWRRLLRNINPAPETVTLDPATAHPSLRVSDDLSCMRRCETAQAVSCYPERFSDRRCALASQGYTGGRHYWEVDVGSCTFWVLGVARESVPRCGKLQLDPQAGVWALELRWQDGYKALSSPPTYLAPTVKPKKLGIYLDYEGGWLAFYDAGDMSHLYTFRDTFREKLYPYFSTSCKANPLRVISLQL